MDPTFEQRRRIVLIGFAAFSAALLTAAVIWHEAVQRGLRWLFSESLGAVLLLAFISTVFALRAKRRVTLAAMRRTDAAQTPHSHFTPPALRAAKALVIVAAALLAMIIWLRTR